MTIVWCVCVCVVTWVPYNRSLMQLLIKTLCVHYFRVVIKEMHAINRLFADETNQTFVDHNELWQGKQHHIQNDLGYNTILINDASTFTNENISSLSIL